ncbi:MAG: glycosyltransferase family 2 protein [Gemmatimonadota bacterium]|nr:glycosyltransferase family 2 protein [Gemmatimonadota bacterium]
MVTFALGILVFLNGLVLVYFVAINLVYFVTSAKALQVIWRYRQRLQAFNLLDPARALAAPPITVLAPAYNEELTCVESVRSLLTLDYPRHEIIVINDGSKDGTVGTLISAFELTPRARLATATLASASVRAVYQSRVHSNLWVIDKENGGKADALNTGLNYCNSPLVCAVDADTLLERDALTRIVRPFLEDARTVAVGGKIRVVNDCTVRSGIVTDARLPSNYLAAVQTVEYLRAFLVGRVGWAAFNASLVISGAFGLFSRGAVVEAGGYGSERTTGETVGEDMELVVRMKRLFTDQGRPCKIEFVPDSVAWTEVPESYRVLGRQRDRWQRGLIESLFRHRVMLFKPRFGPTGMVAFPVFLFLEGLGPVIELAGYLSFSILVLAGDASGAYVVGFFVLAFAMGVALSAIAVMIEELAFARYTRVTDVIKMFVLASAENFGYRQLNTFWRVRGLYYSLIGRKSWGKMERKGFQATADAPGALN